MMRYKLKYLFKIIYKNGEEYCQNIDDISLVDNTKSCYYDIKLEEVKYFILSDGVTSYALDLLDGGISINGSEKFYLTMDNLTNFEPWYFRRITLNPFQQINYIFGFKAIAKSGEIVYKNIVIK